MTGCPKGAGLTGCPLLSRLSETVALFFVSEKSTFNYFHGKNDIIFNYLRELGMHFLMESINKKIYKAKVTRKFGSFKQLEIQIANLFL